MNIFEFFDYINVCPICNDKLTKEAQIYVFVDSNMMDFSLAGCMFYSFNGIKFVKNSNKLILEKNSRSVLKSLENSFPETFTVNKRFGLRINKIKASYKIKPLYLNSLDVKFNRICCKESHTYCIESQYLYEGEDGKKLNVSKESLQAYDIMIVNDFYDDKQFQTQINNKEILPYIKITKWNLNSALDLKNQIEKYKILK